MKNTIFLAAMLVLHAPLAGAAFKCVDEKGLTRIGDTPPEQCGNVVMYEIKPNGTVIRKIDPTPSPEQLKQLREEAERKREADKMAAAQKRRDEALLNTYSNEKEFEIARDRNIEPIRGRINNAKERLKVIEERETKIAEEMEFYKAGKKKSGKKDADAPPPMLVAEKEGLEKERQSIHATMAAQEKEIEELRTRYDTDRKRWVVLKAGTAGTQAKADAPPASQPVRKN